MAFDNSEIGKLENNTPSDQLVFSEEIIDIKIKLNEVIEVVNILIKYLRMKQSL